MLKGGILNVRTFAAGAAMAALFGAAGAMHAQRSSHPAPSDVITDLRIVAPAAPGGGWDQLAREMAREIEGRRLAAVQVENIPGAAGTIGLAQLVDGRRGDGRTLMVNGLVMLGAILWNESPVSLAQTTPIARLTGEYEIVAVPAASPHRDMQSLLAAIRENAEAVSWGGGSAGGTDHILAGLIVADAGIDPRRTNYIAFSGGGEAATALLGGQVTAGISGYSEFAQYIESGRLRAIAISSRTRVPGRDVPTLLEQGIDVELANWRAVVAPPGLDDEERRALTLLVERMARSESWRATAARLGWTDLYLAGPEFDAFLETERTRVTRIVTRLRGVDGGTPAGRVGEWVFPVVVLTACAVVFLLLALRRASAGGLERFRFVRGIRLQPDAGRSPGRHEPVLRVAAGLLLFVAFLNPAGFVVAGTALFVCTASAFGSRAWLRDGALGLAFCAATYLVFVHGLGVTLP